MRTKLPLLVIVPSFLGAVGCDYSGDWLFPGAVDGLLGVQHLGEIEPAVVENDADIREATYLGEVGPTGTAEPGGVTAAFVGTGGDVCVWVDPELVTWNQSVAARNPRVTFSYPDNVMDDGDLDVSVGFAAYYSGTAANQDDGGRIGDFRVRYEDSLDQEISVLFNECVITTQLQDSGGAAGRGAPESCTVANTQPGVSYIVLLKTWNTPLDDDRLGFGFLVTAGACGELRDAWSGNGLGANSECLIRGEAVDPRDPSQSVPGSEDAEAAFCSDRPNDLPVFCRNEAELIASGEKDCEVDKCFCGDPANTPTAGSF